MIVKAAPLPLIKVDLGYRLRTARFGAAAVADGDFIYVIGGANSEDTPLDEIERIDLRTGRSEVFAHLTIGRRDHRAILQRGKIYVLGGYNAVHFEANEFFEDSVEVVDLKTGQVTRAPPMPVAKASFACAATDDKIYVVGGALRRNRAILNVNTTETFEFATGRWEKGVPMPTPRMSVAAIVGNDVLVVGGFRGQREVADVEAFFPGENGWRVLPKLHKSIGGNSLVFLDHFLFLFGSHELIAYDLKTKQSDSYRFDYTAAAETATVVHRGRIYVIGGTRGNRTTDNSMAGFFLPAPIPSALPRREPDEKSAELDAISFADTDKLTLLLNGSKDYAAMDDVQIFELKKITAPEKK